MTDAILVVDRLEKRFGGNRAVDGASFDVERGSITGLIGPNGAGKTTCFNCIAGAIRPDGGQVTLNGVDVTGWPPHRVYDRGLARTFQIPQELGGMTVLENVMLMARDHPGEHVWEPILRPWKVRDREAEAREQAMAMLRQVDLEPLAHERAGTLSGGQRKLLELARALMAEPELVLLDEPSAGVNPTLASRLVEDIRAINSERGVTFLVIGHDMDVVARLCDRLIVMTGGRVLIEGTPDEVLNNAEVQEAYLGSQYLVTLLEVTDLEAGYGDVLIVRGSSITVDPGEIVTIIGPNGAGKSTLLKAIFGLIDIVGGSVHFNGEDVTRRPAHRLVEMGAAFVPQTDNVFPRLSIRENLEMGAFRRKTGTNTRIEELLARFPDLGSRPKEQAGRLSGGQRQTLAMCRALMLDPTLLLVDEPTAALSPSARQDLFGQIQAIRDTGVAILMVEQNAREALEVSDRGYVLVNGAVALTDRADAMLANDEIGRMFLGRSEVAE